MNTYLAIITTALVITQIIRLIQNRIQLRRQHILFMEELGHLADAKITEDDFNTQRKAYRLIVEYLERRVEEKMQTANADKIDEQGKDGLTMREKLYNLIHNFIFDGNDVSDMNLADHLIANGVTVLTPDEARNIYTVQEIEKLQGEAYDLGAESVLHNHYGLSWHDAEKVRKEVAKLQSVSKWIPVTERLPEYRQIVAVCVHFPFDENARMAVAPYTPEMQPMFWERVTHWMPLPEPPKGE